MSTSRARFGRRSPLPDLKELTIMFQTLELQNLNKLVEGEIRDFPTPKPFHAVKVQRLGGNTVEPSAEIGRKFPMPISTLVANFTVKVLAPHDTNC